VNYNKIDFVKNRKVFFGISLGITILGIITLAIFGLNFGVEFKSGTSLDITINKSITQQQAIEVYEEAGFSVVPTVGGTDNNRISNRFSDVLSDDERTAVLNAFTAYNDGETAAYEENTVDAGMAREFALKAIVVVAIASIGIIIYVSIRFEWRFALTAIVALLHDAFLVISIFSIFRLEVNLVFIAAILTIIGYSINDTIVIFDRIRENLRFAKLKSFDDLAELVNQSIRQTFIRSINTALTVIFAAACLFIFGSEAIRLFSLALLIGLFFGGYSSIFIASQLWLIMKSKSIKKTIRDSAAS
jgi:preprotein translocase SecF subunit